jgi:predicted phosphodiesterase
MLAVLSDVHGNVTALQAVLQDVAARNIGVFAFLGDLVINGPAPQEVFTLLTNRSPQVWIKGNTDAWFEEFEAGWQPSNAKEAELATIHAYAKPRLTDSEIRVLKSKPLTQSFEIDGIPVLAVHGSPRSFSEGMDNHTPQNKLEKALADVSEPMVVCAHTHRPCVIELPGKTLVNVGSVGLPADEDPRASYAILERISTAQIKASIIRVEYDIQEAVKTARLNHFPFIERYQGWLEKARF